jgi:hypothetical protein
VSVLTAVVGVVQAVAADSLDALWMWLFFGALALVVATIYSFHRGRMEVEAKKESLPHRIDDLHREGIDLLTELRTPVEVETTPDGGITFSGEWPPDEWWQKVEAFERRIRALFIAHYPALLFDYAEELEARLRKKREAVEPPPLGGGSKQATSAKMLAFANDMRRGPARRLEASLDGLKSARHRLGYDPLSS